MLFDNSGPDRRRQVLRFWIGYFRPSPTLAIEGLTRLSERVPGIEFKETSRLSFPGDHAFILSTFLLFFWYFGRAGLIWISTILTIVFVFPRMMSGAHWATDVIVGGFAPALIATSIMYATPLHQVIMSVLCPVIEAIANRLPERLLIPDKGYDTHKKGGYLR